MGEVAIIHKTGGDANRGDLILAVSLGGTIISPMNHPHALPKPMQFSLGFLFATTAVAAFGLLGWQAYWPVIEAANDWMDAAETEVWAEVVGYSFFLSPLVVMPLVVAACLCRFSRWLVLVWLVALGDFLFEGFVPVIGGLYQFAVAPALLAGSLMLCIWSVRHRVSIIPLLASWPCAFVFGFWGGMFMD